MMPYFLISKVDITILEIYNIYLNMQGFALNNISDCYVGNNQVSAVYLGNVKIWPTTHDYSRDYLTFEALEPTSFSFTQNDLQYSLDNGSTWTTLTAGNSTPQLSTGNKILWKQTGLTTNYGIGTFSATGKFNACGNIMSLVYGDNFIGQTTLSQNTMFESLFQSCNKIINANNLILPATTLADYCYYFMFDACSSLTTAPELPATTLALGCYQVMFDACSSLTTAPELPATTLTNSCYEGMFSACSSLTTAPELPATTLTTFCYERMFYGCTALNYIKCLATDISAYNCTLNWLNNVSSTGTFVKNASMSSWTTGVDGIPSGWTVQNA